MKNRGDAVLLHYDQISHGAFCLTIGATERLNWKDAKLRLLRKIVGAAFTIRACCQRKTSQIEPQVKKMNRGVLSVRVGCLEINKWF